MNSTRSLLSFLLFLALAIGFFVLIRFEIQYGIAGGKFGGAEMATMPGTFWFVISIQALWGSSLLADAVKELRRFIYGAANKPAIPANLNAVYWLLVMAFLLIINLLAIWSAFEMLFTMFQLLADYEMPRKAILGILFLLCVSVFGYLCYVFLFGSLMDTYHSRVKDAFQRLQKNNK